MKPGKQIHILIVNNAEKGITEFTKPLEKIVAEAGFTSETIEYRDCMYFDFETVVYISLIAKIIKPLQINRFIHSLKLTFHGCFVACFR